MERSSGYSIGIVNIFFFYGALLNGEDYFPERKTEIEACFCFPPQIQILLLILIGASFNAKKRAMA